MNMNQEPVLLRMEGICKDGIPPDAERKQEILRAACRTANTRVFELAQNNPEYEVQEIQSPLAHEKKKYGLQFLPDTAYGAGFYVCKLVRK